MSKSYPYHSAVTQSQMQSLAVFPTLETVQSLILDEKKGNCVPIFAQLPGDLMTPCMAYLRVSNGSKYSYLLESVIAGENVARFSFVGADPVKVIRIGPNENVQGDPMKVLEKELEGREYVKVKEVETFTGGAVGYVAYEGIIHFEPKTAETVKALEVQRRQRGKGREGEEEREGQGGLKDPLGIPEAVFMITDATVVYDHLYQNVKVVAHVFCPDISHSGPAEEEVDVEGDRLKVELAYYEAVQKVQKLARVLMQTTPPPEPHQPPITAPLKGLGAAKSNVGKDGYEAFVTKLKQHIVAGDIIQAVPSQRLARPTKVHPFNVYRQLRQVNPSPYMFYLDCGDVKFVGASPETLCKVEANKVYNHAIAGTVKRGKTVEEDERLGEQLRGSEKDRAEHIMLVDLARNDVNRVCDAKTVKVDHLMRVEKFSHVIHLTSQISGMLREGLTRFDAFRSIFPAGTVSGAPKIKAVELVFGLERERRGVYAGAVGRWDFANDEMDTCIAIRTMTFKNGVAYLQAGGGIVFDSVEEEEYVETVNKLGANLKAIDAAEEYWFKIQQVQNMPVS